MSAATLSHLVKLIGARQKLLIRAKGDWNDGDFAVAHHWVCLAKMLEAGKQELRCSFIVGAEFPDNAFCDLHEPDGPIGWKVLSNFMHGHRSRRHPTCGWTRSCTRAETVSAMYSRVISPTFPF